MSRRTLVLGAIIVFHILLVYGLTTGLAYKVVEIITPPLQTEIIEEIQSHPLWPEPPALRASTTLHSNSPVPALPGGVNRWGTDHGLPATAHQIPHEELAICLKGRELPLSYPVSMRIETATLRRGPLALPVDA